jgi:hypothetical protein
MIRLALEVAVLIQHFEVALPRVILAIFPRTVQISDVRGQVFGVGVVVDVQVGPRGQKLPVVLLTRTHHYRDGVLPVSVPPHLLGHVPVTIGVFERQVKHVVVDVSTVGFEVAWTPANKL